MFRIVICQVQNLAIDYYRQLLDKTELPNYTVAEVIKDPVYTTMFHPKTQKYFLCLVGFGRQRSEKICVYFGTREGLKTLSYACQAGTRRCNFLDTLHVTTTSSSTDGDNGTIISSFFKKKGGHRETEGSGRLVRRRRRMR